MLDMVVMHMHCLIIQVMMALGVVIIDITNTVIMALIMRRDMIVVGTKFVHSWERILVHVEVVMCMAVVVLV